jgi:3-oxoadipate enol-lactonase
MWDAQRLELERRFHLIRYDVRGHGKTPAGPGPYTLDQLGGDLVRLLDELGLERVHFCGLSLGGQLGMWLATRHGGRVDRLVLCNTGARIGALETWTARMDAARAGGIAAVADAVLERWFTESFRGRQPGAVARARAMLQATSLGGYLGCCAALRDADERERLPGIAAPTLVVAGRFDAATTPALGRAVAEAIPGARYAELPAAHLSNIEAAEAFTAELAGFLARGGHG